MTLMSNRQTGRTQRMLDASVEEARAGEYVIVVGFGSTLGHLYDRLLEYDGAEPTNRESGKVYFPGGGSVSVVTSQNVDLVRGMSWGAHPSVKLHADHYLLEQEMGWMLDEWLRWSGLAHFGGTADE